MKCRNCGSEDAYQSLLEQFPECPVVSCKYYSARRLQETLEVMAKNLFSTSSKTLSDDEITVIKNPYFTDGKI